MRKNCRHQAEPPAVACYGAPPESRGQAFDHFNFGVERRCGGGLLRHNNAAVTSPANRQDLRGGCAVNVKHEFSVVVDEWASGRLDMQALRMQT
jgi:hypothetical protein